VRAVDQPALFIISAMFKPLTLTLEVEAALQLLGEYLVMSIHADCKTCLTHRETVSLATGLNGLT